LIAAGDDFEIGDFDAEHTAGGDRGVEGSDAEADAAWLGFVNTFDYGGVETADGFNGKEVAGSTNVENAAVAVGVFGYGVGNGSYGEKFSVHDSG